MRTGTDLINYIDKLRSEKGLTWTEIAERSGVSMATLRMCGNRNQYPGVKTLYEISRIFSVSIENLLDVDELAKDNKEKTELPPDIQEMVDMLLCISQDRLEEIENNIKFIYEKEMRKKDAGTEVG